MPPSHDKRGCELVIFPVTGSYSLISRRCQKLVKRFMFAPLQRPCGDLSGIKTSKGGKKDTLKTDAKMCQAIRGGGGGEGAGAGREKEEEDRQTERLKILT